MTQEQITALLLALVALENSRDGIGDEVARLAHEHQSTLELYGLRATAARDSDEAVQTD